MAYKWPDKDPDEILDYSVDWSRLLGDDTLSAAVWFIKDSTGTKVQLSDAQVVNNLQFVQSTISGKVATARFSLGTVNVRYVVVCQITSGEGLQYERDIYLRIQEK